MRGGKRKDGKGGGAGCGSNPSLRNKSARVFDLCLSYFDHSDYDFDDRCAQTRVSRSHGVLNFTRCRTFERRSSGETDVWKNPPEAKILPR